MQLLSIWRLAAVLALSSSQLSVAAETNGGSNIGLKLLAEGLNAPAVLNSLRRSVWSHLGGALVRSGAL